MTHQSFGVVHHEVLGSSSEVLECFDDPLNPELLPFALVRLNEDQSAGRKRSNENPVAMDFRVFVHPHEIVSRKSISITSPAT